MHVIILRNHTNVVNILFIFHEFFIKDLQMRCMKNRRLFVAWRIEKYSRTHVWRLQSFEHERARRKNLNTSFIVVDNRHNCRSYRSDFTWSMQRTTRIRRFEVRSISSFRIDNFSSHKDFVSRVRQRRTDKWFDYFCEFVNNKSQSTIHHSTNFVVAAKRLSYSIDFC